MKGEREREKKKKKLALNGMASQGREEREMDRKTEEKRRKKIGIEMKT